MIVGSKFPNIELCRLFAFPEKDELLKLPFIPLFMPFILFRLVLAFNVEGWCICLWNCCCCWLFLIETFSNRFATCWRAFCFWRLLIAADLKSSIPETVTGGTNDGLVGEDICLPSIFFVSFDIELLLLDSTAEVEAVLFPPLLVLISTSLLLPLEPTLGVIFNAGFAACERKLCPDLISKICRRERLASRLSSSS